MQDQMNTNPDCLWHIISCELYKCTFAGTGRHCMLGMLGMQCHFTCRLKLECTMAHKPSVLYHQKSLSMQHRGEGRGREGQGERV